MPRELRWVTLSDGRSVARFFNPEETQPERSHLPMPQIARDYAAYDCPITGKPVEGRAAHRENLKRHGCRILEPGETAQHKRERAKERDAKISRQIEQCTLEAAREMTW